MVFQPRHRKETREITGSPRFIYTIGATNQNVRAYVNCENTTPTGSTALTVRKYLPFNWFKISNNSGQTIEFYINMSPSDKIFMPDGTITTVEGTALHSFFIIPTTGNISANKVKVECKRTPLTSDKFARDISKNVFVRALLGY